MINDFDFWPWVLVGVPQRANQPAQEGAKTEHVGGDV